MIFNAMISLAATQVVKAASDETINEIRRLLKPLSQAEATNNEANHGEARFRLMQHFMLASENLPLQLVARTLFNQFAPNMSAVADFAAPDRERYAVYAQQLDDALLHRDILALRATFDAFIELNRESMKRAFMLAQRGQEAIA